MTSLRCAAGVVLVDDHCLALCAPPELTELVSAVRAAPPLFFHQPRERATCSYRTDHGQGAIVSPLSEVGRLVGRVIVEVAGAWLVGEVGRG